MTKKVFFFPGQCGYNVEKVLLVQKSEIVFFVDLDVSYTVIQFHYHFEISKEKKKIQFAYEMLHTSFIIVK